MMIDNLSLTIYRLRRAILVATCMLLVTACSSQQVRPDVHESLNATLWAQTAAEYAAVTTQAYHVAASNLDLALADPQWTAALEQQGDYTGLPPAVMMDIDQTVLDNSRYNARIIMQHGGHSLEKFTEWCEEAAAPAIPGAKEFADYAVERGVTIIYYSKRREYMRDCTTGNLEAFGFPLSGQEHLLLHDDARSTSKAQQRTGLASQFRILLLVGDDLDDFVTGSKADPTTRRAIASQHAGRWGREWIILPNPMYGAWETSLYEFDYSMPRDERLDRKLQQLLQ
jgi:5'-nucleotidase (lipoprotein e(P4) family)